MSGRDIQITNLQTTVTIDQEAVRSAVTRVLSDANVPNADISVAIVDNPTIRQLNQQHLQHDYATDVLSFAFESSPSIVDGEIIVSAEMAEQVAATLGATPLDELLLYVVHGALHLVGFDDKDPTARNAMLERELKTLESLGIAAPVKRSLPVGSVRGVE